MTRAIQVVAPVVAQVVALVGALLVVGCTSEQLYNTGRAAQRAECNKQPDASQRDRCFKDAGMSHDDYQRQASAPH